MNDFKYRRNIVAELKVLIEEPRVQDTVYDITSLKRTNGGSF